MLFQRLTYIFYLVCFVAFEVMIILGLNMIIDKTTTATQNIQNEQNKLSDNIINDMECFPVPKQYRNRIYYSDSYGDDRIQGSHDGCDILDESDCPGQIPIVSCTNGIITNMGWLFLGGYRIGITSKSGLYYYYAHLDSYAEGLKVGDRVYAGEFIGFMGNSGEGNEGTEGKFPTHLHFGIYQFDISNQGINPYPYLKKLE